jgi:hypothetical protein
MAKLLKLRRGTTTQHNTFTGAEGEITIDITKDTVVVHNGTTAGGHPLLRQDLSNLPVGSVTSSHLADGTIVNADINASAAIASAKLATTGVTAGNYGASTAVPVLSINAQGQVTAASTAPLPAGIVTTSDTGTVTSTMIANETIATSDLASNAVTTAKISDGNVTTAKIADSNVTTAKIADSNVTTAKIADSNVTTAKIADSNVTTAKIADGNVTTSKLSDSGVTAGTFRSVTVDAKGRVTGASNPTTFAGYGLSDTSANLASAISDETGTGPLVFATSPAFGGTPTAPTAAAGTNTTQLATTAFVTAAANTAQTNAQNASVPTARTVSVGSQLSGGGALSGNITLSHATVSTQANVSVGTGSVVNSMTFSNGHVTGIGTADYNSHFFNTLNIPDYVGFNNNCNCHGDCDYNCHNCGGMRFVDNGGQISHTYYNCRTRWNCNCY